MSQNLFYFFSGFPAFFYGSTGLATPADVPLSILPNIVNYRLLLNLNNDNIQVLPAFGDYPAGNYNVVFQDYSSIFLWQVLSKILLTTTIPIEGEAVVLKGNQGTPTTQRVLTDFNIQQQLDGIQRQYLFYDAQFPRWSNIKTPGDLRRIDLRVWVQFANLQTIQLPIPPTFELEVKLMFKRRKAYNLLQYTKKDTKMTQYR